MAQISNVQKYQENTMIVDAPTKNPNISGFFTGSRYRFRKSRIFSGEVIQPNNPPKATGMYARHISC